MCFIDSRSSAFAVGVPTFAQLSPSLAFASSKLVTGAFGSTTGAVSCAAPFLPFLPFPFFAGTSGVAAVTAGFSFAAFAMLSAVSAASFLAASEPSTEPLRDAL